MEVPFRSRDWVMLQWRPENSNRACSAMASAMRPTLGKRGDSYTLTSRVKEHIDQLSAMSAVSKKSSQVDSMNVVVDQASNTAQSSRTVRTGVAPRKVEFEGRIQDLKELYTKLSIPGHLCFLSGDRGDWKVCSSC